MGRLIPNVMCENKINFAMNKKELKLRYFEKGSTALRRVTTIEQDCYCCPICQIFFTPQSIENGVLTIEHAPPEKVGGWPLALTCKDCNSISGYTIDAAVVNREKLFNSAKAITGEKDNFEGRASLTVGSETINVRVEVNNGTISIKPPKEINDPKKLEAYTKYLKSLHEEQKWDGEKFTITPRDKYHKKYSQIGDLKSAFIICFALFGYTYALNNRLDVVREQILNFESDIIDKYWLVSDKKIERDYFVLLVKDPLPAVAVRIDKVTILLPWLSGPENFYQYLSDNYSSETSLNFHGEFFKWPHELVMGMDYYERTKTKSISD